MITRLLEEIQTQLTSAKATIDPVVVLVPSQIELPMRILEGLLLEPVDRVNAKQIESPTANHTTKLLPNCPIERWTGGIHEPHLLILHINTQSAKG